MRRRILSIVLILLFSISLCSCGAQQTSTFSITFFDVGQGDSALVECDGKYMLIDGGDKTAGQKVYDALVEEGVKELEILAISHLHADHIGGLPKVLTYASEVGITICNSDYANTNVFRELERQLNINGSKITIPDTGEIYNLGSAEVEVIDVADKKENDSLVLMVTYKGKKFLFSGDIEESAMTRISDRFQNESDEPYKIDLIKMPHHGAKDNDKYEENISTNRFLRTFMPDYFVISLGENIYDHPHWHTIELIEQLLSAQDIDVESHLFRTDKHGDIMVVVEDGQIHIK